MAKLANAKGEMVYFNLVQKNGKLQWVIKGIGTRWCWAGIARRRSPAPSPRKPRRMPI